MAAEETSTVPMFTREDFQDPTAARPNRILARIYEELDRSTKAVDLSGILKRLAALETSGSSGTGPPSIFPPVTEFGVVADAREITDANTTTTSAIVTSISANFNPVDVGRLMIIVQAGASNGPLVSRIVTVDSPTQVTLADNASQSVVDVFAVIGTDNFALAQAAIDSLGPIGCGLEWPQGKYVLSGTLDADVKKLTLSLRNCEIYTPVALFETTPDSDLQVNDGGSVSLRGFSRDNSRISFLGRIGAAVSTSFSTASNYRNFTLVARDTNNQATGALFNEAYLLDVEHVWVLGFNKGARVTGVGGNGPTKGFSNVVSLDNISVREFVSYGLQLDHVNDCTLYNFHCFSSTPRDYGLIIETQGAGIYIQTATISNCGGIIKNTLVNPATTTDIYELPPQFIFADHLICDFGTSHGLTLDDSLFTIRPDGQSSRSLHFVDSWAVAGRTAGTFGVYIGGGFDLSFCDFRVRNSNHHGIYVKQFNSDLRFVNVISCGNNFDDLSDGAGLYIASTVGSKRLQVVGGAYGGRIPGDEPNATGGELYGHQKYGIYNNSTAVFLDISAPELDRNEYRPFGGGMGDRPMVWGRQFGPPRNYLQEASVNVSNATNATPVVITTSSPHGYVSGEIVRIYGVSGNLGANGDFAINVTGGSSFEPVGSGGSGAYTGGGQASRFGKLVTGATNATPIVVTVVGHGYATNDRARIEGVLGNLAANGDWWINVLGANTFELVGSVGTGAYTSGGTAKPLDVQINYNRIFAEKVRYECGDENFYLDFGSTGPNPVIGFDAGDYFQFVRATNQLRFHLNNIPAWRFTSNAGNNSIQFQGRPNGSGALTDSFLNLSIDADTAERFGLTYEGKASWGDGTTVAAILQRSTTVGLKLASGKLGIGIDPTAKLHLPAVTTAAASASAKIAPGVVMTTPEDGAVEYDGANLFFTIGTSRRIIAGTFYYGTGSPEGIVVANIGDIYLRSDGDQGTSIYFKTRSNGLNTGWLARAQYHQLQIQNTHPSTGFTWLRVTASLTAPQGTNPLHTWEDSGGGIVAQVWDTGRAEFKALGINLTKPSTDGHLRISTFLGVNTNTPLGTEKVNVTGDSIFNGNCVFGGTTLTGGYAETHHGSAEFKANVDFPALTASRALVLNSGKTVAVSSVTDTELGYLSGVSSGIQSQINGKVDQVGVTAHTVPLRKLVEVTGTDGSITWNAQGLVTGYVDPT